jgi:hypothetical protein
MSDGFRERLLSIGEAGSAHTNTTAASLLPAARKFTLPSYFFDRVGKGLLIRAAGQISTVVTTPGTLTLDVMLGSVIVFSSGAMTLNTSAQSAKPWVYEAELVCRAIGSGTSANLLGIGRFTSHAVIGSTADATTGGAGTHILPYNATPAAGTGFDSTASQTLDFYADWSSSSASNTITLHQFSLDVYT